MSQNDKLDVSSHLHFTSPLAQKYARAFLESYKTAPPYTLIQEIERVGIKIENNREILVILSALHGQSPELISLATCALGKFKTCPTFKPLIELLIKHHRLPLLGEVLCSVAVLYRKDHAIIPCTVFYAHELTDQQKKNLELFIKNNIITNKIYTEKTAEISYVLDKKLIAGIKITTQNKTWEHSVAQVLRRF